MSSTAEKRIVDTVRSYLVRGSVPRDASILVGVSGGPDSTALLRALHALGLELSCCYYDHGLRAAGETGAEREFVRRLAGELGLSFYSEAAPPGKIEESARVEGTGIEAAARKHRYDFFRRIGKNTGAGYLALGHTRDDQDETVLMRVCRGAGFSGLTGIPETGDSLLRPLIRRTRREIVDYLDSIGQDYLTDPTNEECYFLRNRVRNRVMPLLSEEFPGLSTALERFREKAGLADDYLKEEAGRRVLWTRDGEEYLTDWNRFLDAPGIVRLYSLYSVFDSLTADEGESKELPYRFLRPLVFLEESIGEGTIPRPEEAGAVLARGHGIRLEVRSFRAGLRLAARRDVAKASKKGYCVILEDNFPFNSELLGLQIEKTLVSSDRGKGPRIDFEGLVRPVVVRSSRPGDTIQLKEGKKRVRKLFQEWKIGKDDTWRIPVLEDGGGIKAVLGSFVDAADRFAVDIPSANPKQPKSQLVFSKFGVRRSEFSE